MIYYWVIISFWSVSWFIYPDSVGKVLVLRLAELTGFGVDAEEALWVPAADLVAQFVAGASVGVEGVDLNDGDVFGRILHDGGVVNRFWGLRSIVVHILDLDVALYKGGERDHATVAGVHRQPVVWHWLTVQQLQSPDHTWGEKERERERVSFNTISTPAHPLNLNSSVQTIQKCWTATCYCIIKYNNQSFSSMQMKSTCQNWFLRAGGYAQYAQYAHL